MKQNHRRKIWRFWVFLTALVILGGGVAHAQEEIFSENFEDPALPGWERSNNAEVVDGSLHIGGDGYAFYNGEWGNQFFHVTASAESGSAIKISYRASEEGEYIIQVEQGEITLFKGGEPIGNQVIEQIPSGEWFLVEVLAAGESHDISLNGQLVLSVSDPGGLPPGGLVLAAEGNATGHFDDLFVESLEGESPPEDPDGVETPQEPEPDPQEVDSTEETAIPPSQDDSEGTASPGELTWVRTGGPPGGIGYDIRYKFDDPTTWYVTENFAGVHISTDNGLTWQPSKVGIPGQLGPTNDWRPIFSLTIDPHNPDIIWAGTDKTGRIYKSLDGGKTWTQKDKGVIKQTNEFDYLSFRGFTVDPNTSEIVYAMGEIGDSANGGPLAWSQANGGVIYKTLDGGENWDLIWDGGIPSSLARYMWINPQDTNILYVSTGIFDRSAANEGNPETEIDPYGGLGVLKSTDGGKTWRILNKENGLNFLYINSLFMHPDDPDVLLAGAAFGETELYGKHLSENNIQTPMGVYRTTDGGETWTQVLAVRGGLHAVEICPSDSNIVYAASNVYVYRSEDAGVTWTRVAGEGVNGWGPPGVLAGKPIDMQCDPNDPNRIFTNNYLGGNFLSTDGGKTWINASDGYTGAQIISVEVDPNNPAQVYVAGRNGIWGSSNGGTSWYGLRYPEPGVQVWGGEWGSIAVDPSDPQHLLASEETIWESYNGGSEWKIRRSPAYAVSGTIAFAPSDPAIVYTGRAETICLVNTEAPCPPGSGVYVSRDGGTTWDFANDSNTENKIIIDLAVDPTNPQKVFAATQEGLYRTTNGGSNWVLMDGLPAGARVDTITIHPQDPQTLMAGLEYHGLYTSKDGGETWQQIPAGLEPNNSIRDVLYDPTNPQIVYLSDTFSGAYQSRDGGQTWKQINHGLTTRSATRMGISSDGQHVYLATNGEGVFRLDINGSPPVPQDIAPVSEEITPEEQVEPEIALEPEEESEIDETIAAEPVKSSGVWIGVGIGVALTLLIGGTAVFIISRRKTARH